MQVTSISGFGRIESVRTFSHVMPSSAKYSIDEPRPPCLVMEPRHVCCSQLPGILQVTSMTLLGRKCLIAARMLSSVIVIAWLCREFVPRPSVAPSTAVSGTPMLRSADREFLSRPSVAPAAVTACLSSGSFWSLRTPKNVLPRKRPGSMPL